MRRYEVSDPDWEDDPHMRDAALLGAIEGETSCAAGTLRCDN